MRFTLVLCLPLLVAAEIAYHPGGKELPHDKYIRLVSEKDSPVLQAYIKAKDGLYIAAAIRKPKGNGPFPVLVYFHGAPGGRGMEQLTGWSLGATGSPVWERLLQEGFVVAVADYRGGQNLRDPGQAAATTITYADDGISVLEYVRALPYVDPSRIGIYGVSLGGDVTAHAISRAKVKAAILGAPATLTFLGVTTRPSTADSADRWKDVPIDSELAKKNIDSISCPVLILVGTADPLMHLAIRLHDMLEQAGKQVRMEVYENGYHDFCIGPQGQPRRKEPLLDATLDALEKSVVFLKR